MTQGKPYKNYRKIMAKRKTAKSAIYVSTVVETDGPIPGPYSLRAIGSVAVDRDGKIVSSFETFLTRLPKTTMHPDNARYWERPQNLETYLRMERLAVEPVDAVSHLINWTAELPGQPVLAAYNASHTWMWVHWYCTQYSTRSPFSLGSLDIKSHAAPFLCQDFLSLTKADLPDSWRMKTDQPDSVVGKAEKQACILTSLINAKRTLSDEIQLPAWTRKVYGPSVRETKREAGSANRMVEAT